MECSEVNSGYGKSILGPLTGSPFGAVVDRTRRSPVKGRLREGNVVLHNVNFLAMPLQKFKPLGKKTGKCIQTSFFKWPSMYAL